MAIIFIINMTYDLFIGLNVTHHLSKSLFNSCVITGFKFEFEIFGFSPYYNFIYYVITIIMCYYDNC